MRYRWLIPFAPLLALATPATAQGPPNQLPSPWRLEQDRADPGIPLGLTRVPLVVAMDFRLPRPAGVLFEGVPFTDWVRTWAMATTARLERERLTLRRNDPETSPSPVTDMNGLPLERDSLFFLSPAVPRDSGRAERELIGGVVGQYADLAMEVTGLGELGGSWTRYEPCDPSLYLNCNPSLFPQLKPNVEFGVKVAGTISDRIHVNVDYDQRREDFSAANNINVFYQGFADEVLQRLEVGDVSLRLPRSTYLTRGVPAGNFGFMASGQLGPIDFQAVWAQQRGDLSTREFRLAGGGTAAGLVQDDQIVLDDADYVKGQFFFLVHPDSIAGSPHIDVLALRSTDTEASLRPEPGGTIEIYRDERIAATNPQQQAQLGIFLAEALSEDGTLKHGGQFRRLNPEQDYIVHNSGLWILLRSPLRSDEALAVSYVTESGDTIGTMNAERAPPGTQPRLRLLRAPVANHQPGRPTWPFEMHQVYRLNSSSGVDLSSVEVRISLGDLAGGRTFVIASGHQVPFLKLFGLDEDAPEDAVDVAQIYQPGRDDFGGATSQSARIGGTYIVFPTLQPFLDPPPGASAGLTEAEARAALGADANGVIYENADPVVRDGGGRFRLNFHYRVKVDGLVSSFSLGQFGIRENTERLQIGDRVLERGIDYAIDYEVGTVTLNDAPALFAASPGAEIRATWEQKSLFDVAPTSVFGASATYRLGPRGELNFVGIYQAERTLYTRPQLGVEPGAIFLGGASANLDLGGSWLDRVLESVPGLRAGGRTTARLDAELAFSLPNPNRDGAAYLDDFEGGNETPIDVRRQEWKLGSAPESTLGGDGSFPLVFDASTATPFIWQHDFSNNGAIGGNLVPHQQIDRQINIAGNALPEPVMWLTFGNEGTGAPRWRSITTVLSTTGLDMTRSEFIEFYASAGGELPLSLVFDIGAVSEDALFVDSLGNTSGTRDGRPWGLGHLDEEARVADREIWGLDKDARGLWDQACTAEPLTAYGLGDARSNCTRGNGILDTEDTDGNGILDASDGAYFRYIVHLTRPSQYLVRDTAATETVFRLYRIPLRSGSGIAVNGASDGTWRFIRHLRMTVVGEPGNVRRQFSLARIRVIGSRWTKRDVHGIKRGLLTDQDGLGTATARLQVGPVSRLTDGGQYSPPPGVREQLQDPSAQFGAAGIEFNERSLRIRYDDLEPGDRAEIYFRYAQAPQNFLTYRQIRLWAVARNGDWGPNGGERLVVRAGTDARNSYLFQTPLRAATGQRPVITADWQPEIVIDFNRWIELKALAERRLIEQGPTIGMDTIWSADSTYAIVLEDRARAPNLASIRELTFAVYNGGGVAVDGEVWLDDLRLTSVLRDPGMAGNVSFSLNNEFLGLTASYSNRGSVFRQLDETPSFLSAGDFRINARTQLDRFLPAGWDVDMPVNVEHTASVQDPQFLERSDVRADRLEGLRETGGGLTRVNVQLRKRTPSSNPWLGLLVDGTTLRFGYNAAGTNSITSRAEASGFDAALDYRHDLTARDLDVVPSFVESVLRALAPSALENSDAFRRLVGSRLRWNPEFIGFSSSYANQESRSFRFDRILALPSDTAVRPIASPRRGLENALQVGLRPFEPLSAALTLSSSRDLLEPERASTQAREREALERARTRFAGTDVGWETRRSLGSTLTFRPSITSWLRPSYTYTNRFRTDRNPSYIEILEDSTTVLQRRFGSDRQVTRRLDFQPARLLESTFGVPDSVSGAGGLLYDVAHAFSTLNVIWNSGRNSTFERESFQPGTGYQLGLGDFSSFRFIDGDTSATATDRDDFRVNSGFDMPFDGLLTLGYQRSRLEGFDIRGGRRTERQIAWPSARMTWRQIPLPAWMSGVLVAASADAGYERAERSSELGGRTAVRRGGLEERFPLGLSLTFAQGITTSYTGTITRGTSQDPTGDAENNGVNHTLQLSGIFQAPGFLRPKITNPIQTLLIFTQDDQRRCRFPLQLLAAESCVPFVDTSVRTVNLTVDTRLSDLNVGVRMGYTSRHNFVGTQTGSSQFQLGIFGQFNFTAGQVGGVR